MRLATLNRVAHPAAPAAYLNHALQVTAAALVTGVLPLPATIGGMIARHRHRKRSGGATPIAQPVAERDAGRQASVCAFEPRR